MARKSKKKEEELKPRPVRPVMWLAERVRLCVAPHNKGGIGVPDNNGNRVGIAGIAVQGRKPTDQYLHRIGMVSLGVCKARLDKDRDFSRLYPAVCRGSGGR